MIYKEDVTCRRLIVDVIVVAKLMLSTAGCLIRLEENLRNRKCVNTWTYRIYEREMARCVDDPFKISSPGDRCQRDW